MKKYIIIIGLFFVPTIISLVVMHLYLPQECFSLGNSTGNSTETVLFKKIIDYKEKTNMEIIAIKQNCLEVNNSKYSVVVLQDRNSKEAKPFLIDEAANRIIENTKITDCTLDNPSMSILTIGAAVDSISEEEEVFCDTIGKGGLHLPLETEEVYAKGYNEDNLKNKKLLCFSRGEFEDYFGSYDFSQCYDYNPTDNTLKLVYAYDQTIDNVTVRRAREAYGDGDD